MRVTETHSSVPGERNEKRWRRRSCAARSSSTADPDERSEHHHGRNQSERYSAVKKAALSRHHGDATAIPFEDCERLVCSSTLTSSKSITVIPLPQVSF
jgi:hypothetical protein